MTFIVGMANQYSCVISADNVVTANRPIRAGLGVSSSGQLLGVDVNDSAFKLFTPRDNCIAGASGDSAICVAIMEQIKSADGLKTLEDYKSFLHSQQATKGKHTTVLIGLFDEVSETNHLLLWESSVPTYLNEGSFFSAGSGKAVLRDMSADLVSEIMGSKIKTEQKAAALSMYYNQKLFHSAGKQLSLLGVGGCFFSVGLDGGRFAPQDDTAILRPELIPANQMIHAPIIKLAYRHGILFINSSISHEKKGLLNSINCSDEIFQAIKRHGNDALKPPQFDIEEIWDLANVRNVEIHFEFDNIPSLLRTCDPGELLAFGESRTDVVLSPELVEEIIRLIQDAH